MKRTEGAALLLLVHCIHEERAIEKYVSRLAGVQTIDGLIGLTAGVVQVRVRLFRLYLGRVSAAPLSSP
jgi:hypothetical protein